MFHTLFIPKLTLAFTCGMEFYHFSNHFTTIIQGCYNSARLQTPCTNCHNLVTTLLQLYKVAARLLQPSYFHMGIRILPISSAQSFYGTELYEKPILCIVQTFSMMSQDDCHVNCSSCRKPPLNHWDRHCFSDLSSSSSSY